VKPVPGTVAALTVTAAVPVEDRVSVSVVAVFTFTLPKDKVDELTLSVGTEAPNFSAKVFDKLPALAVRVTVCAVLTEETVAVKVALLAPAFTSSEVGTVTALLLLARLTVNPRLPAAPFRDTVQLSLPASAMELLLQLSALRVVAAAGRHANKTVRSRPVQKRRKQSTSARPVAWRRFRRGGWVHRDASCAANLF
jgi:hypothetical protein